MDVLSNHAINLTVLGLIGLTDHLRQYKVVLYIDTKLIPTSHALPVLCDAATGVTVVRSLTPYASDTHIDKVTACVPNRI